MYFMLKNNKVPIALSCQHNTCNIGLATREARATKLQMDNHVSCLWHNTKNGTQYQENNLNEMDT